MEKILDALLQDASYFSFLVVMLVLFLVFAYAQFQKDDFDLRTTVTSDGQVSLGKFGQLVALMVSSWGFVHLVAHNNISEWYFFAYTALWAGNSSLEKFLEYRSKSVTPDQRE